MITDEMIEKVTKAIRGGFPRDIMWNEVAKENARIALEAAYPLIAAQVLEEAAVEVDLIAEDFNSCCSHWRPSVACRGVAAAIRALKAKYEVSK